MGLFGASTCRYDLKQMTPSNSTNYPANVLLVNAELLRKHFSRHLERFVYSSYLQNLSLRKLCRFCSFSKNVPLFISGINLVLKWGSGKKMIWITTAWVIALVAYIKPFWNWAVKNLPHQPVSVAFYFFTIFPNINLSITRRKLVSQPRPTLLPCSDVDAIPKALFSSPISDTCFSVAHSFKVYGKSFAKVKL